MASAYYGLDAGKNADSAEVGSSTNSTDIEIRADMTKVLSREALLVGIDNLKAFILEQSFPAI
jgi:hypothetical protein